MPRYRYRCQKCESEVTIFHGISESILNCEICEEHDCMEKLLTTPRYIKKIKPKKPQKVGELTREYIEKNKEVLEQQKEEARKEKYEQT